LEGKIFSTVLDNNLFQPRINRCLFQNSVEVGVIHVLGFTNAMAALSGVSQAMAWSLVVGHALDLVLDKVSAT
jgi:uncharacterized membrane protein